MNPVINVQTLTVDVICKNIYVTILIFMGKCNHLIFGYSWHAGVGKVVNMFWNSMHISILFFSVELQNHSSYPQKLEIFYWLDTYFGLSIIKTSVTNVLALLLELQDMDTA